MEPGDEQADDVGDGDEEPEVLTAQLPHEQLQPYGGGWTNSQVVCYGSWIGQVYSWEQDVTIGFEDGAVCRVSGKDERKVQVDSDDSESEWGELVPGCPVIAPASVLRGAAWLKGSFSRREHRGGVCLAVKPSAVQVQWSESVDPTSPTPPSHTIPVSDALLQRITMRCPRDYVLWASGAPGLITAEGRRTFDRQQQGLAGTGGDEGEGEGVVSGMVGLSGTVDDGHSGAA